MGFIVGKAYPIIRSMADGGNQEAKKLLDGLDSMDQAKVDEMVSSLLGGGGNNKPSSFTDMAESYGDDLPKDKLPKTAGEQEQMRKELRKEEIETALKNDDGDDLPKNAIPKNMEEYQEVQKLLGIQEQETQKKLGIKSDEPKEKKIENKRGQLGNVEYNIDIVDGKITIGVIGGVGFEVDEKGQVSHRAGRGTKSLDGRLKKLQKMYEPNPDDPLSPENDAQKTELKNIMENANSIYGNKKANAVLKKAKELMVEFGVKDWGDKMDFLLARIFDPKNAR